MNSPAAIAESLEAARHWDQLTGQERGLSWLASLLVHLSLFLVFSWWWTPTPRGARLEPDRAAGIVLAGESSGAVEYFGPESDAADSTDSASSAGASAGGAGDGLSLPPGALPGDDARPLDSDGLLPAPGDGGAGGLASDGLPGAGDLAKDSGSQSAGRAGGKKGHTYLFGIEGVGNKFLYVFDRSASMESYEGRPLAAAKAELARSLEPLESTHQFQIIFYNDRQNVFNPYLPQPPRMLFADDKHKDLARRYLRSVTADGGTQHLDALRLALGLNPDVVFFLTDADEPPLSAEELTKVVQWSGGAVIHAIEFGAGPQRRGVNFLQRIAELTGGRHIYVDVTRLPR